MEANKLRDIFYGRLTVNDSDYWLSGSESDDSVMNWVSPKPQSPMLKIEDNEEEKKMEQNEASVELP